MRCHAMQYYIKMNVQFKKKCIARQVYSTVNETLYAYIISGHFINLWIPIPGHYCWLPASSAHHTSYCMHTNTHTKYNNKKKIRKEMKIISGRSQKSGVSKPNGAMQMTHIFTLVRARLSSTPKRLSDLSVTIGTFARPIFTICKLCVCGFGVGWAKR